LVVFGGCAPFSAAVVGGDDSVSGGADAASGSTDAGGSVVATGDASVSRDGASDADASGLEGGLPGTDASTIDAGIDAGPVATFYCPLTGGNVADCSACSGYPLQCELCGGPSPRTFCTTGRICNSSQTLSYWCPCAGGNDSSQCPLAHQTCYSGLGTPICLTCGEQNATDGYSCKGGGTCSESSYLCK
jgi:hypothetical protein